MKFGVRYCNTARYTKPENAVELVQAAEAAGFESAWTVDHVVVPEGYESKYPYTDDGKMAGGKNDIPLPDPLIWMSYVAARTEKINFGTGILIVPQRNPVVAAKQIATLDFMTGGRVLLGIGVGWMEEEFNASVIYIILSIEIESWQLWQISASLSRPVREIETGTITLRNSSA